ncbi:MAG: hypothetical protein IPM54_17820 [Polyangiaceae bacterium]|nr:hypothetical protein [Polyangiaceae bacterium]
MMHARIFAMFLVATALLVCSTMPIARAGEPGASAPLVIHVIVPLCSNEQIDCGSPAAGAAGNLRTNLYWGALFGHRRFFDRKQSEFARIDVARGKGALLERAVYRRMIPGAAEGRTIEQIVVLDAYHGASIDQAVDMFWHRATHGGVVHFRDGEKDREVRVSIAGYAGHNRLMDGVELPAVPKGRATAIPSFVLACASEQYFGPALRAAGSETLVMTRTLMAPEGYVLDAVVRAIGDGAAPAQIRGAAVKAYAKWQKLSESVAGTIFAKTE